MARHTTSPMTRRSLLALGGTSALSATLAACAGGSDAPTASAPSDSARASAGGRVALAQWYHQYGEEGVRQAVERYAQEYRAADVSVAWRPGDYERSTAEALLTDAGPDVFEYANGPTIDMIKGGQVVDMTDLFGDALDDFTPALIERMSYDGKIWGIPQALDLQVLVYRRSLLEQAGLTPPQQIVNLVAAAAELTRGEVKGLFLGNDGGAAVMGGPMLWAAGLDYLDGDRVGFEGAGAAEALSVLRTLWTEESLLLGAAQDWDAPDAFISGQTAMAWTGMWTFPAITEALGDDYGAIPWPTLEGGALSVPIGAYASCVSARSTDVQAAQAFAAWLWIEQSDKQLDFATSYGSHLPSRLSLVPEADAGAVGPITDAATLVKEYGHPQTPLLWTPTCATAWEAMMGRIVRDGADPQDELEALVPIVEDELERVTS